IVSVLLLLARILHPRIAPEQTAIPLSVIALEGFLTLVVMTAARVAVRLMHEHAERNERSADDPRPLRALLVGAGRAGRMAARELRQCPDAGYEPIGFLDDSPERQGQEIEHVRVLGTTADAPTIARSTQADALILTMPSASGTMVRGVVERCRATGLPIQTVPGLHELLRGTGDLTAIRPLSIDDLLGRAVFAVDELAQARVRAAIAGKRVLVTGAGGSIGSELCRQLVALDPERLVLVESCENNLFEIDAELRPKLGDRLASCLVDIRSPGEVAETFDAHRPHVVFHAAAFKHVPMMESHPGRAVHNNVYGTRVLIEAARRVRCKRFVYVSTDKAVDPSSVMGATKRAAELLVLAHDAEADTDFLVVRFGNVLGSKGSVLHTFARQIEAGGPVTVTHPDVTRYFMTTTEAVRLVLQAAVVGKGGEVFLLDMGEPVKIVDLAQHMIDIAGPRARGVAIHFVGLRPGEKTHEALVSSREAASPSGVPGLLAVHGETPPLAEVDPWVGELQRAVARRDDRALLQLLARRTGYVPANHEGEARDDAEVEGSTAAG
ncbi:MAG TPA: nucleoside-diphosphate sugar epimerase/dehydratase, partial [Nannocystaceae bacterium]|nr:nucleoside-diphosphate sugar epimerase/dehydratase [Nannocystaceae bacterium]